MSFSTTEADCYSWHLGETDTSWRVVNISYYVDISDRIFAGAVCRVALSAALIGVTDDVIG